MNDFSILTIMSAAIVDSINPCAIGVLVFLMAFLASIKGSKKKILSIGLTYIAVVYLCYFTVGLGLLKVLNIVPFLEYIYLIVGVVVLIAGAIDFVDGIKKTDKPVLAIPKSASPRIKKYIRKATVPAAIALGGIVAFVELPCTGAVYLSVITMLSDEGLTLQTFALIALYNLIFVLPLLIILILVVLGLSSEKIEDWRKKNRSAMRVILGIAMVLLGLLMISNGVNKVF